MDAQQRQEGRELEPAGVQFVPLVDGFRRRVRGKAWRNGKSTAVDRPVGDARNRKAEARRDLLLQRRPGRGDVTRPGRSGITLLTGKSVAGQDEDALIGCCGSLPL